LLAEIPTGRLLDEAWAACRSEEKNGMRANVLGQLQNATEANVMDLDSLDDVEVDRLYHSTLRKIAAGSPC